MSGTIVRAVSMSLFDFSRVADGQWTEFNAYPLVDTSQYREVTILVRVHKATISGFASIYINAYVMAPTTEDPALWTQVAAENIGSFGANSLTSSTVAPTLRVALVNHPSQLGGRLLLGISRSQTTPPPPLI